MALRTQFISCLGFLLLLLHCLNQVAIADSEVYAPPLGYGYNPKTSETLGEASNFFDAALVKENTSAGTARAERDETLVETIEDILRVTRTSANVQVKTGLFKAEGQFSSLVRKATNKRTITYLLTASIVQPFNIYSLRNGFRFFTNYLKIFR